MFDIYTNSAPPYHFASAPPPDNTPQIESTVLQPNAKPKAHGPLNIFTPLAQGLIWLLHPNQMGTKPSHFPFGPLGG